MWTNVFKIGGLHHVSWFQFLPCESLPDKSVKVETNDFATFLVLSSQLQLQNGGFFSTWTNSFVGPWDPSQGLHNPDEKIKLWLFIPGHHSAVVEAAQAAVSRLKVVANGLWSAPGDSEEVSSALSQALRNHIERSMKEFMYMRFGDVFSRYHALQSEELFRRDRPTVEFIFAATEEAVYVHVLISSKHIRSVSSADIESLSNHSNNTSVEKLPVIVSPHGMRGWITGCCPSDLVKQVYFSSGKLKTSNGVIGLPFHISQGSGCQLSRQSLYVEVTLGFPTDGFKGPTRSHCVGSFQRHQSSENRSMRRGTQNGPTDQSSLQKTFIYPTEAVVIPVMQMTSAKSFLKRFWLQNWIGPSFSASSFFLHCSDETDDMDGSCIEVNGTHTCESYNSSSNSNNSSISTISSSSSDSVYNITADGDLEADADSLTCVQYGLSSNNRLDNDCRKLGSKRARTGISEPFGQVINTPACDAYKSGFSDRAVAVAENEQIGSYEDWDHEDIRVGLDIQALLSEFGDFGDFFENDALPFGEPPGTAESQTLMYSGPECGDVVSSPCTGVMDVTDQMFLPVGFPSSPFPVAAEESHCKNHQNNCTGNSLSAEPANCTTASSSGEFDHLIKAEALMIFAPEYGAVEIPTKELSSSIFRCPYLPQSQKLKNGDSQANNYIYAATPPTSPCLDISDDKLGVQLNSKAYLGGQYISGIPYIYKYYTCMEHEKEQYRKFYPSNLRANSSEVVASPFSGFNSFNAVKSSYMKPMEVAYGTELLLQSMKTLLATEVGCIMFQVFMCRSRHTNSSLNTPVSIGLNMLHGNTNFNQFPVERSSLTDNVFSKFDVKNKDSIPLRIAGDIDGGMLDGTLNASVGVWRTVGIPKSMENTRSPGAEICSPLSQNFFSDEVKLSYGQRQPLQELLDGLTFLVQQATSLVDLSLDGDYGDGIFGWLALHEQRRRGSCCGPSMIHAGCGGSLASCHSVDISGMKLEDPLSANVHASSVISLLQSDIKIVLKTAFSSVEGPMTVVDWCKGCIKSGDAINASDGFSTGSALSESIDASRIATSVAVAEPFSPSQTSRGGSSCFKGLHNASIYFTGISDTVLTTEAVTACSSVDGVRTNEACNLLRPCSRVLPTVVPIPLPAILVGYQDDWLKTSANSLQLWEKAPFEPYALQKPVTYYVVCPDIDPLTSAAADFFEQLGTVYEACKLGGHSPSSFGNRMVKNPSKPSSSGFILFDSPQSMKIESNNASFVGSISDYFLALSNGWNLMSFLQSLSSVLKNLKLGSWLTANPKEGYCSSCMVIYVVCPFPEPTAVLQTVVESSVAIGSTILSSDRERRSLLYSQIAKALNVSAAVDEASMSNVFTLPGFSVPKIVLQIVTVDAIFRVSNPSFHELVLLKELAFTVYNKARRISRGCSNEAVHSSFSGRRVTSPGLGLWKDCVGGPRNQGSLISRENETLIPWDSNSWQTPRTLGLESIDQTRCGDFSFQDESRYVFEPLFILAEPGFVEHGILPSESSRLMSDESPSSTGSVDTGSGSQIDGSESDVVGYGHQKNPPSIHCCYGWTEDWRWLVCMWTDSRGEMLDSHIFPFGGISSRQDTKGMQCVFVKILQQGCLILQASSLESGAAKPRDFVITRIGCFYELECQEWQRAIYAVGGCEVKKWPLQLRQSVPDMMSNGTSIQQQDSPSSPTSLFASNKASSAFMKGAGLGQQHPVSRQHVAGSEISKGLLQWMHSISLVTVSIDNSLQLISQADSTSGVLYTEGLSPVKAFNPKTSSYLLIPSPTFRFLPQTPLQLPTCLTADSPPLAHLLHSKGPAAPLVTAFVVSKSVHKSDEWPSTLSVSLVDHYGGKIVVPEKRAIVESAAAQLHGLSWMSASPAYPDRRTGLPFHCDLVLRLGRLLHFAEGCLNPEDSGKGD